ncbi:Eco57I restriction-modification methylase domain-containing protein [Anaerosporobacter faecicola]|uniref:Eco57I restriction-modification methylase domain-containing protein n=1 Tax=Anaerosporobacter faecicola TaxID=2718714 RepID=UPI0014399465|nr:N-6 DNA methylase [Anaerosporobacter faecicola]
MPVYTKCQVFTPPDNVKKLLDVVGYERNLFGRKVAENSCGDGNILIEIVKRYISDCFRQEFNIETIKVGLQEDIWAAEIDKSHIENCKIRLDAVVEHYGIRDVSWNILEGDVLKENIIDRFDFVIGNPPYITYKELDEDERRFVRDKYETCKVGKFDYCYAFIEASIRSLTDNGKFAYLIPSNIFKNRFAQNLRDFILPCLTDVYDYTNQKLFTGKLTASAIIVCDRNTNNTFINYHNVSNHTRIQVDKDKMKAKWVFSNVENTENENTVRFGDCFHAASSIATLLNKVFIIDNYIENGDYLSVGEYKIEKALLRDAVSPRAFNYEKSEKVIFPYYYSEEGLQRYTVEQFESQYPQAVIYLKQYQDKLEKRKSDVGISWFEYGRSQALAHLNQPKLLISTLITGSAKVYAIDRDTIPTSGIYIVPKDNKQKYSLEKAKDILNSELFLQYVKTIGVISNGNSYRISPKDINDFCFPRNMLL